MQAMTPETVLHRLEAGWGGQKMRATIIGLVIPLCAFALSGCDRVQEAKHPAASESSKIMLSKAQVIAIAEAYVKKTSPDLDISQKEPTAEFVADAPAQGGPIWIVGFAYPAPKDPMTGKTTGVRPFIGYTVWVGSDGSVKGAVSHSP
jgi:hypothetical protein